MKKRIKVSHEVPFSLLNYSREFNDYDYCLPHLLDENEYCDEVLEMANQAQSEMISGVIKFLEKNNKEINLENINRFLHRLSSKVLSVYILTF